MRSDICHSTETTKPVRSKRTIMRADLDCVFSVETISRMTVPTKQSRVNSTLSSKLHSTEGTHPMGRPPTDSESLNTTINGNLMGNFPTLAIRNRLL